MLKLTVRKLTVDTVAADARHTGDTKRNLQRGLNFQTANQFVEDVSTHIVQQACSPEPPDNVIRPGMFRNVFLCVTFSLMCLAHPLCPRYLVSLISY